MNKTRLSATCMNTTTPYNTTSISPLQQLTVTNTYQQNLAINNPQTSLYHQTSAYDAGDDSDNYIQANQFNADLFP